MALTQEQIQRAREMAQARGSSLPTGATTSGSLLDKYGIGTQKPTVTSEPTLKDRLSSLGTGALDVGKGVVKSFVQPVAEGANLLSKGEDYVQNKAIELAGAIKGATPEDIETYKQDVGIPETQKMKQETAEAIQEKATTRNTAQDVGKAIGDVAQFMAIPEAKGATILGRTAERFGTGYSTSELQGGNTTENVTSGVINAVVPGVGPALKGIGTGIKETLGATTGVGGGVIGKAWQAAKAGGKQLEAFKQGLGESADAIVQEAKDALGLIIKDRSNTYQTALSGLKGSTQQLNIKPINDAVQKGLKDFNVKVTKDGLDFSRSTLALDNAAQKEMAQIYDTMKTWGTQKGDRLIIGVDTLKRMFGDLYSDSSAIRSFSKSVENAAKEVGKQVPGYEKMLKDYAESTGLIKEIQKGLSLKDTVQVETAFKKLTSALRTNNDMRKKLIEELDKASGGFLSSKIAGQQMSEILPRGLSARVVEGGAIAAAGFTGLTSWLPAMVLASPKAVQGMIRALGIPAKYAQPLFDAIAANQNLVSGVVQQGAKAIIDNPEKETTAESSQGLLKK